MQKGCVNRQIASLPLVYNNKLPFPLYEEDEEDVPDFRRRPYRRLPSTRPYRPRRPRRPQVGTRF